MNTDEVERLRQANASMARDLIDLGDRLKAAEATIRLKNEIILAMNRGECRCRKFIDGEQGHDTHCAEQYAALVDGYCKTIREQAEELKRLKADNESQAVHYDRLIARTHGLEQQLEALALTLQTDALTIAASSRLLILYGDNRKPRPTRLQARLSLNDKAIEEIRHVLSTYQPQSAAERPPVQENK